MNSLLPEFAQVIVYVNFKSSWIIYEPIINLYSRKRMIILKNPERVLISVAGDVGVQYINNDITLNY